MAAIYLDQIFEHWRDELEDNFGYFYLEKTFDLGDAPETRIDGAFVLIPGTGTRAERIRSITDEIIIEIALKATPGLEATQKVALTRLNIVWHFLKRENYGPAEAVEWTSSEVTLGGDFHILRLTFSVSYQGLIKSANE